jgi:hypothetical protein
MPAAFSFACKATYTVIGRRPDQMWGVFAGIALWVVFYPAIRDWRQRQADKKRLAEMRKHFSLRHRWDALKGRWIDE